ncbi:MAG: hypothetical protein JST75_05025 [Bacteroidetes bacterium]|nr:hypothetical protein [Bacteroidota bacterium]
MKIRIKGNSLRYRLTRTEVEKFGATGYIEEKINFGENALYYSLQRTDERELSATFENNRIIFFLPVFLIDKWINTDVIGFEYNMALSNSNENLFLLVEKDFTCLDKVEEDQSDNYPNPLLKN